MAKARSLVGLDVHATKIVAAVLDVETGELAFFSMTAEIARVVAFCAGLPGRCGWRMRPARPGTGSRGSSRGWGGCVVAAPSKIPRGVRGAGQDRSP